MSTVYTPLASMPGALPGDRDIPVAFPDAATQLTATVSDTATTLSVANGAFFPLSGAQVTILRIDNELIRVSARTGNTLTVAPGGRGFSGSAAAQHFSGAAVRGVVSSYVLNRMREEVQSLAVQVADNRAYDFVGVSGLDFTGFSFSPGGQLITFTAESPCPPGVAGSNNSHYIRVASATQSEVVLITGGTATGGGAGTLIFSTVFTYTGTVTIRSATAGIQEAVNVSPSVRIASGSYTLYATVNLPYKACIAGAGQGATELLPGDANLVFFDNPNKVSAMETYKWTIRGMSFNGRAFTTNLLRGISLVNTHQGHNPGEPPVIYLNDGCSSFENLTFRNIRHAVYLDRVTDVRLINIDALDNTTTYIGDTTGASRTWNVVVRDYLHHQQQKPDPHIPANMAAGTALLTLDRCIACVVDQFQSMGFSYDIDGILLKGFCEAVTVSNCVVVACRNAMLVAAGGGGVPTWNRIMNFHADNYSVAGINLDNAMFTSIVGGVISQNDGGACPNGNGIRVSANGEGAMISGNIFQAFDTATQSAIKVEQFAKNFSILNNYFINSAPATDINIVGGSDYFLIIGNNWSSTATSTKLSAGVNQGDQRAVVGNTPDLGTTTINAEGVYWPKFSIMEMGSVTVAGSRFWDIHSSGNNHDGDFRLIWSGGTGTPFKGDMQLAGRVLNMTQLSAGPILPTFTFATLPPANTAPGLIVWGSDCTVASPTAGGGPGALCVSNGTIWIGK